MFEIKQPNLSAMENGRKPIPSELAKKVAKRLHCKAKKLIA